MRLALLLGLLAMLGSLNIDLYLPALPEVAVDLGTRASLVQLTLTGCLLGLAVGQQVVGSISDAGGRRRPLLVSLALFVLCSAVAALAPSIAVLIVARVLQGLTASAGIVISRAMVRDLFTGAELTAFFGMLMAVNAAGPMLAPALGGMILLLPGATWRTVFAVLAGLGALILALAALRLQESHPPERRIAASPGSVLRTMLGLLRDRGFLGYAVIAAFVQGGSFAYVAGTPFVYQGVYGVSPQAFGLLFGLNGLAIMSGSTVVARLSRRVPTRALLRTAILLAVSAAAVLVLALAMHGPLVTVVVPIFAYMTGMGMTATSAFSLAMEAQAHRAGSASALLGMAPQLVGAGAAPLVGVLGVTGVPMGSIMLATATVGLAAFTATGWSLRGRALGPASPA